MYIQKEYDVLRLIGHNRVCYVSSDNIKGCSLATWIKYHPYLSKEQLIEWICDLIRQLEQMYKCRGNPYYQYVNPYSIIVSKQGELCFLDVGADSNKERVRWMHKRNIREYFLPEKEKYCQYTGEELDIYGAGKTVQYLLAFTEAEPGFTRKEEKYLQKMILKCINRDDKRAFQKIQEVQKYVSKLKIR